MLFYKPKFIKFDISYSEYIMRYIEQGVLPEKILFVTENSTLRYSVSERMPVSGNMYIYSGTDISPDSDIILISLGCCKNLDVDMINRSGGIVVMDNESGFMYSILPL